MSDARHERERPVGASDAQRQTAPSSAASDARAQLGRQGEALAEKYLRDRGLKTLARRFATPAGELDLVMRDGDTVVFVEVKALRSDTLIEPHEHWRRPQQRRLAKAARWYLAQQGWQERPCRVDVVGVLLPPAGPPRIDHIPDAQPLDAR